MRAFLLSCAALTLMVPTTTSAKPAFVGSVPNASALSCNTCHVAGSPKSVRNDFGIDVKANLKGGMPDWSALCELDSDGDGATNGEELQDMLCEWVSGSDPGCSALLTAPGDANSVPSNSFCGDGVCDDGEDVDCCLEDCDIPEPPPVDEDETDAGVADDVMEEDVPPMDDVTPEDDVPPAEEDVPPTEEDVPPTEEDVPPAEDTNVPIPAEDVVPGDDAGMPPADVDPGPSEDVGGDPPPADAGTTPADAGTTPAPETSDDGGCAVHHQAPPVWMALLALLFVPFVLRRRED